MPQIYPVKFPVKKTNLSAHLSLTSLPGIKSLHLVHCNDPWTCWAETSQKYPWPTSEPMLKFFRTIRKRLLAENKFSKYVLYALGEIFLVVVGILIALAINDHQQYKKDRGVESRNLQKFSSDLTQDSLLLQKLILREQHIMQDIDTLFSILLANDEAAVMKVFEKSESVGASSVFNANTGTFDEAVSTGTLQTLLDDSLRSDIFAYYKRAKNNLEDKITDHYQTTQIVPELLDIVGSSRQAVQFVMNAVNPHLEPLSVTALLENPDFNKLLIWRRANSSILIGNWESFLSENARLHQRIREELGEE